MRITEPIAILPLLEGREPVIISVSGTLIGKKAFFIAALALMHPDKSRAISLPENMFADRAVHAFKDLQIFVRLIMDKNASNCGIIAAPLNNLCCKVIRTRHLVSSSVSSVAYRSGTLSFIRNSVWIRLHRIAILSLRLGFM